MTGPEIERQVAVPAVVGRSSLRRIHPGVTPRALRALVCAFLALAGLMVPVTPAIAGPRADAAPTASRPKGPIDYDKIALEIFEQINKARANPAGMADSLEKMVPTFDGQRITLPSGFTVVVSQPKLNVSIREARQQPALPPLKWSQLVAQYGGTYLAYQEKWGHGGAANAPPRVIPAGLTKAPKEGSGAADADPLSHVYEGWVSWFDPWDPNLPYDPSQSWKVDKGNPLWRGHRGIVNDGAAQTMGVSCIANRYPWDTAGTMPSARCAINFTDELASDASDVVARPDGKVSLTDVTSPMKGTIGSAVNGGVGSGTMTVSVDTSAPTPSRPADPNNPAPASAAPAAPGTTDGTAGGGTPAASPAASASKALQLCQNDSYAGPCTIVTSDVPDLSGTEVGNDKLSSVRVPAGTWVSLYRDFNYGGTCRAFSSDQASLTDLPPGADQVSSVRISTVAPTGCPTQDVLTLCPEDNFLGTCITPGADQPDTTETALGNDKLSSVLVPVGTYLAVYQDLNYQGPCQSFSGDRAVLAGTRIGTDQVSSFKITKTPPVDCAAT